ncbi:MAG: hypothetical protein ABSB71_07990 [Candidatus Bathyarchaeia archaeon]|jgi:hypothetical protein
MKKKIDEVSRILFLLILAMITLFIAMVLAFMGLFALFFMSTVVGFGSLGIGLFLFFKWYANEFTIYE